MIKKQFEVNLVNTNKEKVVVKPTSYKIEQELKTFYAITYRKSISMGVATKASMLDILKREGVWGDKEEEGLTKIATEIGLIEVDFNKSILQKSSKEKQKELAIKLAKARTQLYTLIQIKSAPLAHTAESIAEECKIDKLISLSSFYEDGRPYFKDHDDFIARRNNDDVLELYDAVVTELSKDNAEFLLNLPENKWLVDNGMMSTDGAMEVEHFVNLLKNYDEEQKEEAVDTVTNVADIPTEKETQDVSIEQPEQQVTEKKKSKSKKQKDKVEING